MCRTPPAPYLRKAAAEAYNLAYYTLYLGKIEVETRRSIYAEKVQEKSDEAFKNAEILRIIAIAFVHFGKMCVILNCVPLSYDLGRGNLFF